MTASPDMMKSVLLIRRRPLALSTWEKPERSSKAMSGSFAVKPRGELWSRSDTCWMMPSSESSTWSTALKWPTSDRLSNRRRRDTASASRWRPPCFYITLNVYCCKANIRRIIVLFGQSDVAFTMCTSALWSTVGDVRPSVSYALAHAERLRFGWGHTALRCSWLEETAVVGAHSPPIGRFS